VSTNTRIGLVVILGVCLICIGLADCVANTTPLEKMLTGLALVVVASALALRNLDSES
jgi:hypothetical protein